MKRKIFSGVFLILLIGIASIIFFERKNFHVVDDENILAVVSEDEQNNKQIISSLRDLYNNDEIVAILKFDNTDIEIPITQGIDNKEYLTKNAFKESDIEGNPFLDYRTDIHGSPKLLIYGHNSPDRDVPFKYLDNYYDKDFFLNHQYLTLVTDKEDIKYQIFSVYVETKNWDYMNLNFTNEDEWEEHIKRLKANSFYDTKVSVDKQDQILILQTCSEKEDYKNFANKYLLVISRRVT